jgi:hypothetical protein
MLLQHSRKLLVFPKSGTFKDFEKSEKMYANLVEYFVFIQLPKVEHCCWQVLVMNFAKVIFQPITVLAFGGGGGANYILVHAEHKYLWNYFVSCATAGCFVLWSRRDMDYCEQALFVSSAVCVNMKQSGLFLFGHCVLYQCCAAACFLYLTLHTVHAFLVYWTMFHQMNI